MPLLLDFSNETLYLIIQNIHPHDILNFSLCRKEIHLLTKETLKEVKTWEQAYTHVVLHGCHRHQKNSHPLRLIRDIWMDWRIGEFPKSLEVECCNVDENKSDNKDDDKENEAEQREDDNTIRTIMQDIESYTKQRAATTGYLPSSELDDFCDLIKKGYRAAMIGLLLLFLPNLEKLSLQDYTWNASRLGKMIGTIAGQDLRRNPPRSNGLSKLSQIQILGSEVNRQGEDFEFLVQFAALPSMRTLRGKYVVALDDDDSMIWPFGSRVSDVTEITLHQSAVGISPLTQIFSGIHALKRFTYSHGQFFPDNSTMKAHKIIGALLEHAGESLEYVALTGYCSDRFPEQDDHYNKGSLQGFRVLKEAFLHSAIHVDWVPYDGSSTNPDGGIYGDGYQEAIRALVDILPGSIETVRLIGEDVVRHLDSLLANLWEQKHLRLSKLNNIIVHAHLMLAHRPWVRSLTQLCDSIGVTLEFR
ncbi:MAG: hypothetical protein ALECFALPRED_006107 [Alectoria fallacina]|uniref:F-box domain-containing protein n=1 Tax=Alectoria fallacina TaxID=1903189 RepID=A0A8H3ET29_9LECA|nr:MAG: hypothetical protein ALECFALPRED_006107 [Alectoria fallacina]